MQPYPRSPDLVCPGHLQGTGCLSARAMDTGFPSFLWRLYLGLGCAWIWVSVTRPALAGVLGGCVWVRVVVSPLFSRLGFAVFVVGLGFRPAPHHSWLGFWGVRGCVRAPPVPRRSRFGCEVWACVLGFEFRLRPATPREFVWVCVCLCARPAWSPASSGLGCDAGVCAWARVAAAPRHSWLRCWGLCVFVFAPRLYPAIPGWVVLCGRASSALVSAVPRPSWFGCWGVCAFVRVPRLRPALPGVPPVARGCAGVAVGGVCPPPSPLFFFGRGASWRVVSWLCGVCRWLSRSWVPWSPSPHPLSLRLRLRVFFVFVFFSPPQRGVCPRVQGVPSPGGRCSWFGVAGFGLVVLRCPPGGPVFDAVWVGGLAASCGVGGRFRGCGPYSCPPPRPPCFFFRGESACSPLYLPWAGARPRRHSVWSFGLLLVLAFCQALPRPHRSGGLCTRCARRSFLPG